MSENFFVLEGLIKSGVSRLNVARQVSCKLKWYVSIHSHPQGSIRSSTFWCQIKAYIFLIITPKFQLQIHYALEVIAENVPFSGIPILTFLCIFMTASSSVLHIKRK